MFPMVSLAHFFAQAGRDYCVSIYAIHEVSTHDRYRVPVKVKYIDQFEGQNQLICLNVDSYELVKNRLYFKKPTSN